MLKVKYESGMGLPESNRKQDYSGLNIDLMKSKVVWLVVLGLEIKGQSK